MPDRARPSPVRRGARLAALSLAFASLFGCVGSSTGIVPPAGPVPKAPAPTSKTTTEALIAEIGYHERQVYEQQRSLSLSFACVPEDMWAPPEGNDLRAPVALRGAAADPAIIAAIRATFAFFDDGMRSLEVLHGRFLDLRRLFDASRTDDELLRLVIQEGLSTMYQARRLLDLQRGMEVNGCSLAPLRPPLKAVAELLTSVGEVELPALLKLYEKGANPWVMTLLKVQHDVLLDHDISDVCAKIVAQLQDPTPPEDTAILAWCGYAVAAVDDTSFAKKYLRQAGRAVHDPESAAYALARLKELQELPPMLVRGKGVRVMR
ncbi:MAG: hypothetical protein U0359_41115 [Byssovorax sp.]